MNSAQRVNPAFELTKDNLDYVARICRLVQGMPLGIVLAASWLDTLTPEEIADELTQGIDILESEGNGALPERQRSIRAMMIEFVERTGFDGIAPLPKEVKSTIETAQKLPKLVEYN